MIFALPRKNNSKSKLGVSNLIFATSLAILVIIAGAGFGLYANLVAHPLASTTTSEMMAANTSSAYKFTPKSGAMISNAWLIVAPLGMGEYAVSIHADGLERNGTYFVEGPLSSGSMAVVPISNESMTMNQTSNSELQANNNGTGQYWIVLSKNPVTTFESLELAFLPGMSMQNATIVATVSFTSSSMTMTSSSSS